MKKSIKISLSIFSIFALLCILFSYGCYYIDGCSHLYYDQDVLNHLYIFILITFLVLCLFAFILYKMFKGNKICKFLLIIFIPIAMIISFFQFLILGIIGPYGCSYTKDINNYGKYDLEYHLSYFPTEITSDMQVINFAYYYKYVDVTQTDIYLEVKFESKEIMDNYLNIAMNSLSKSSDIITYQNPYNSNYTDVVSNVKRVLAKEYYVNHISLLEGKYDMIIYEVVTYSYDELIIIYNYTHIGNDIFYGDDPNNGKYYPEILKRFNVSISSENNFNTVYIEDENK